MLLFMTTTYNDRFLTGIILFSLPKEYKDCTYLQESQNPWH